MPITLTVNGRNIEFSAPPRKLLSDTLRERLQVVEVFDERLSTQRFGDYLRRLSGRGPRKAPARAPADRIEPSMDGDPSVEHDVEQLSMSTLSFQDYVRERMAKRRQEEADQRSKLIRITSMITGLTRHRILDCIVQTCPIMQTCCNCMSHHR